MLKSLFVILTLLGASTLYGAQTLDIYWIDAEGGASTLFVTPSGESMLVDTANKAPGDRDAKRIYAATQAAGITKIDYLLTSVLHDDDTGRCAVFALNRSQNDEINLSLELHGLGNRKLVSAKVLHHPDLKAANTLSSPVTVTPIEHTEVSVKGMQLQARLPPLSWNVFVTESG